MKLHLTCLPLLAALAFSVSSCVSSGPPAPAAAPVSGTVGVVDHLPKDWKQPSYYYNSRYYYGGRWETGKFDHNGHAFTNRYLYNGQYLYGGRYSDGIHHGGPPANKKKKKHE